MVHLYVESCKYQPATSKNLQLQCCDVFQHLLRQGCEAVRSDIQTNIIQSALPGAAEIAGVLYLEAACIGHPAMKMSGMSVIFMYFV